MVARRGIGDPRADAHEADGLVRSVGPLVHVVAGLKLAAVRLGQHVDSRQPLHGRDGVPVRDDESERRSVVETQWLGVHHVGDQDLGRGIGCVGERQSVFEGQVVRVGLREYRLHLVRAVVGALEPDVDAVACGVRLLQHVGEEGAGPACGGDCVAARGFPDR